MEKQKHIVSVGGKNYSLLTTHSATQVERIVLLLNNRLRDLSSAASSLNNDTMMILCALSLTDELIMAQDANSRLRRELYEANEFKKQ